MTFLQSCRSDNKAAKLELSKDEAIAMALRDGGEVVKIVGAHGPYEYAGSSYSNTGINNGGWKEGMTRAGNSMDFEVEENFQHIIYAFDNTKGGSMLVGVRKELSKPGDQ